MTLVMTSMMSLNSNDATNVNKRLQQRNHMCNASLEIQSIIKERHRDKNSNKNHSKPL